jgi:outer membrane immunogenic protein
MRKLLFSTVALAALAGPAFAADLPSRKEAPVYVAPVPVFSWTGFYVGADIGASFSATSANPAFTYTGNYIPWTGQSFNSSGFMGGGYVGYNYQLNQNFVLGLEGDFQGTTNSKSATWAPSPVLYPLASATAKSSLDWLGAINGRLGVAYDRALFYAIGGAAWGGVGVSGTLDYAAIPVFGLSQSKTLSGFDVGAGVEYAFTPNWVGRVEYRYYGFSNYSISPASAYLVDPARITTSVNTVRVGLAYLFSAPAPVVAKY